MAILVYLQTLSNTGLVWTTKCSFKHWAGGAPQSALSNTVAGGAPQSAFSNTGLVVHHEVNLRIPSNAGMVVHHEMHLKNV